MKINERDKRFIVVALCIFLFVVGLISLVGNVRYASGFAGGDGSSGSPYQINKIEHLYNVRNDLTAYYIMTADLDFTDDADYEDVANKTQFTSGFGWSPIGGQPYGGDTSFTGFFDGDGYTISNLFLDYTVGNGGENQPTYVGLFGHVSGGSIIHEVGLIDANVTIASTTGYEVAGALVGCLGYGGSSRGDLYYCWSTGYVTGTDATGGLVGRISQGNLFDCFSNCTVSGDDMVGGLIGKHSLDGGVGSISASTTIQDCAATGNVSGAQYVGGFVGYIGDNSTTYNEIYTNCFSSGYVTNSSGNGGGFIGYSVTDNCPTITACYYDNQTSGQTTSDGGTAATTAQMKDFDTFDGDWSISRYYKWGYTHWIIQDDADYPRLEYDIEPSFAGGSGTSASPYLIQYVEQLSFVHAERASCFALNRSLDFDEATHYLDSSNENYYITGDGWEPIGLHPMDSFSYSNAAFTGNFSGANYTISNLFVNALWGGNEYGHSGLFGYIGSDSSTISDLGIVDANVTISATGNECVGILAGRAVGTIRYCYTTGTVTGSDRTGGLVGRYSGGTISYSFSNATVVGDDQVGGFVGYLPIYSGSSYASSSENTTIQDCYARGNVTGDDIVGGFIGQSANQTSYYGFLTNAYSTGYVTANTNVGGFSGLAGNITVSACFWDNQTSNQASSAGSEVAKTTALMYDFTTFDDAGWYIADEGDWVNEVWKIDDDNDYPYLSGATGSGPTNTAPSNDGCSVTNLDDTDNMYAQHKWYCATVNVSDADGYADIDVITLAIYNGSHSNMLWGCTYNETANSFTEYALYEEYCDFDSISSTATRSGNDIDLTFYFTPHWNVTESSDFTALDNDLQVITQDESSASDSDYYDLDFDIVADLLVSGFTCDDDRGDVSQTITFTGTVYYANDPSSSTASSSYPPDAEFTGVSIYDEWNNNEGTDTTIVNGAFSVSFTANSTVGIETYNPYIDMVDAEYTDAEESPTDTYIADKITPVFSVDSSTVYTGETANFTVAMTFQYDSASVTDYSYNIERNSTAFQTGKTTGTFTDTNDTVVVYSYDFTAVTDNNFSITVFTDPSDLTVSWGNIYLLLQAQDSDGTNLPRAVTFTGTLASGASLNQASDNSGYYALATTNGTHTFYVSWNNLLVNTTSSYTVEPDSNGTSLNLVTYVERLDDNSNYALVSVNNTSLSTPQLEGESNILLRDNTISSTKTLALDHLNWKTQTEPVNVQLGTGTYNLGDGDWSWSSSVLTISHEYAGTGDENIQVNWDGSSEPTDPGSSSGGTTDPTPAPDDPDATPPPDDEDETPQLPQLPELTEEDWTNLLAFLIVLIIAILLTVILISLTSKNKKKNGSSSLGGKNGSKKSPLGRKNGSRKPLL